MRRIMAFALTGLLIISLAGCKSYTPKEQMKKIVERQLKTVSFEADIEGKYAFDLTGSYLGATVPAYYQEVLKNIILNGHLAYKLSAVDPPQLGCQLEAGINGLKFALEGYAKDGELYVKYPIFHNYLSMNMNELYEAYSESNGNDAIVPKDAAENLLKLVARRVYDKWALLMADTIDEKELSYTPRWDVEVDGKKKTFQKMVWTLSLESNLMLFKALLTEVKSDEELYQAVVPCLDQELTFSQYQAFVEEMMAGIEDSYQALSSIGTGEQYEVSYTLIYDGKFQLQDLEASIKLDSAGDETIGTVKANYWTKLHFYHQNKVREVSYPSFSEENTTPLLELLNQ